MNIWAMVVRTDPVTLKQRYVSSRSRRTVQSSCLCGVRVADYFSFNGLFSLTFQMTNPAIQNDFSYYRRTLSRRKMANAVRYLYFYCCCCLLLLLWLGQIPQKLPK